ncbi:MAG: hypothetical protein MAG431_00341 [Chloroflexi bacterium]|nr:hypothetical protein [Chloroflexota bacterium]
MLRQADLTHKFETVFEPPQAAILAEVVTDAYSELVKTGDFNELKAIVKDLAEAQKRTESKVEELAEAQKRTESKVGELAEAQKRTETKVEELAEVQKETTYHVQTLAHQMRETNATLGGLGQSVAYSLENEAYRLMPALMEEKYGIKMTERFVRTYIDGEEINLFGRGQRDGKDILIVGEAKLRLDERRKAKTGEIAAFEQLEDKAEVVKRKHPGEKIVLVLIAHHARPSILKAAEGKGILIVQSFEW